MYRMGNMINKVAATKLFDDNSCLVGDRDVIFESVARELLGGESIEFAKKNVYKNRKKIQRVWDWRLYGLLFDTKGVLFGDNLSKCEKTKRFG